MLLLALPGMPTIYDGDELGLVGVEPAPGESLDPKGRSLPGFSRDSARTPMQWDATANAGFTTGRPWLPVQPDFARVNVDVERDDPRSMLSLYRRLLDLRRNDAAVADGTYTPGRRDERVVVFFRELERERRLVTLNFTAEPQRVALEDDVDGQVLLSTHMDRTGAVNGEVHLRPDEGVIIAIRRDTPES